MRTTDDDGIVVIAAGEAEAPDLTIAAEPPANLAAVMYGKAPYDLIDWSGDKALLDRLKASETPADGRLDAVLDRVLSAGPAPAGVPPKLVVIGGERCGAELECERKPADLLHEAQDRSSVERARASGLGATRADARTASTSSRSATSSSRRCRTPMSRTRRRSSRCRSRRCSSTACSRSAPTRTHRCRARTPSATPR